MTSRWSKAWSAVFALQSLLAIPSLTYGQQSVPNLAGPYIPAAVGPQGPSYVTVGPDGSHGAACATCVAPMNHAPSPIIMSPGPQPVGVRSGACVPCISGVDCVDGQGRETRWTDAKPVDFQPLMHGEFIGPIRLPAMMQYRVRLGDELQFIYVLSRQRIDPEYRLQVGDELKIASITDPSINGTVSIQSDGKAYPPMIQSTVNAVGLTIPQLRIELEKAYLKYLKNPAIDVQPILTNTRLRDLQNSVDSRFGTGGQVQNVTVNPDGRINLQMIGSLYVYGLTLDDIRREVNLRYAERVTGIEIEPRLSRQAQHFAWVFGEVGKPGKIELTSPTSVTMALAMAEGVKIGGNQRQVIVVRRADDWRAVATKLDLRGQHLGRRPTPADDIWLRDSDLIIVPKTPIEVLDNQIEQVLTKGLYRVVPFNGITIQRQQ